MTDPTRSTGTTRLVLAWASVGIPLVYGIYNIILKTAPLFGG